MTRQTTTPYAYAIIDANGVILSLHREAIPAGDGWGFDRELVELVAAHRVGDTIDWDAKGREIHAIETR